MRAPRSSVPEEMIEAVARRFRLLGEPARLRLLQILESGEHNVNELTEKLHGNQANVSRHLTAMHDEGLLKRRPDGTSVYYSIADPIVLQLCELVCKSTQEQVRQQLMALSAGTRRKAAPRTARAKPSGSKA